VHADADLTYYLDALHALAAGFRDDVFIAIAARQALAGSVWMVSWVTGWSQWWQRRSTWIGWPQECRRVRAGLSMAHLSPHW
jgi:hypothetical protein